MITPKEAPVLSFSADKGLESWLAKNYGMPSGIWLKIAKKASGIASVTYDQALELALCYGWIDGQVKSFDSIYYLQKFTPRRKASLWSKRNVGKIAELTAAGRMQPSGLAEVEAAKNDGRWQAAYASPTNMEFPKDFMLALKQNKKALEYFNTLSKSNVYAIAFRLATAKTPATRQRRFHAILAMLAKGEFR